MKKGTNGLLVQFRPVAVRSDGVARSRGSGSVGASLRRVSTAIVTVVALVGNSDMAAGIGVLADEEVVVLLDRAAEKLEEHGKQDDSDARAGKHTGGPNVPGG